MRKKIVTIGNSAGVTISPADLQELGIGVGDPVEVTVRGGVLELRAVNKYDGMNLDELSAILDRVRATGIFDPAYADDVLARLAYNSSAIEGNTLTLADTITLLVDKLTPRAGAPLRELYEVSNHREAIARILRAVADDEPLTGRLVKDLHGVLMGHLAHDHGRYRSSSNRITGKSWRPAEPSRVPQLMQQWVDQTEWQTANLDGPPLLEAFAQSHIAFERIHPFSDGNGRTGRALIAYQTVRRYGFPAIVRVDQRSSYITMLDAEDVPGLAVLLATNLTAEADRYSLAPSSSDN